LPDDDKRLEVAELPAAAFAQHVANQVSDVLAMSPDEIDPNAPLTLAGLDSLLAAKLRTRLREELNLRVDTKELLLARPFAEVTNELYDRVQVDLGPRA
jgi:aryl carrier-like protein